MKGDIVNFLMYKQEKIMGIDKSMYLLLEMFLFKEDRVSYGYIELYPETMKIIKTCPFFGLSVAPVKQMQTLLDNGFTYMNLFQGSKNAKEKSL